MPFTIIRNDITKLCVDAIVNAANTDLAQGGGVCGAIFKAAGARELQAACDKLAPIKTGEAVITPRFNLLAKFVIHTAGLVYPLLCAKDGCPVAVDVFKGNTKDETAVLDKIVESKSKRKTKYSKEIRAGKVVNKHKAGKYFTFVGSGDDLKYTVDKAKVEEEASLDGCYIVYTDASQEDMDATETVANYKSLMRVEQAFRNMKTVRLEIRPVYHKTDDRIRCHVFICMLAYYVMWHMNQKLRPIFDADGVGKDRKNTFDYVMETLKCIRKETVEVCGNTSSIITTPTDEQKRILDLLEVAV